MRAATFFKALKRARHEQRLLELGGRISLDLHEAYRASLQIVADNDLGAVKLGGTNSLTRRLFAVDVPYFGALRKSEIVENFGTVYATDLIKPFVEPELVLALKREWRPEFVADCKVDLSDEIAWIAIGLEVPDTVLCDPITNGISALVADRCAAGRLIIGEPVEPTRLRYLEEPSVRLLFDDRVVSKNTRDCRLEGGAFNALQAFLRQWGAMGHSFPANVPIATGGLAPSVSLEGACRVSARINDLQVEFNYR